MQEILRIVRDQPDFQIRDMILNDEILDFGGLKINPLKRNVEKKGKEIQLTLYEFDVFYLLTKNPRWVFSKAQIYSQIWKEPYYQAYDSVMHIIYNLRSKIEDDRKHPSYILTVRGFGYKFNEAWQITKCCKNFLRSVHCIKKCLPFILTVINKNSMQTGDNLYE